MSPTAANASNNGLPTSLTNENFLYNADAAVKVTIDANPGSDVNAKSANDEDDGDEYDDDDVESNPDSDDQHLLLGTR